MTWLTSEKAIIPDPVFGNSTTSLNSYEIDYFRRMFWGRNCASPSSMFFYICFDSTRITIWRKEHSIYTNMGADKKLFTLQNDLHQQSTWMQIESFLK